MRAAAPDPGRASPSRPGISKPTISESVRRLAEAGLVVDTGERTTGRGRVGSLLRAGRRASGARWWSSIAPDGVVAESGRRAGAGASGAPSSGAATRPPAHREPPRPCAAAVAERREGPTAPSGWPWSAPPTPWTGRPGAWCTCPTRRSWSATSTRCACSPRWSRWPGPGRQRRQLGGTCRARCPDAPPRSTTSCYLHLGEGLGCAVVSDGEVRRGHAGLAGEIAHLVTAGPGGRRCR